MTFLEYCKKYNASIEVFNEVGIEDCIKIRVKYLDDNWGHYISINMLEVVDMSELDRQRMVILILENDYLKHKDEVTPKTNPLWVDGGNKVVITEKRNESERILDVFDSLINEITLLDPSDCINDVRSKTAMDPIIIDTRADAERVLDTLVGLIDDYGQVSVADLYDIMGKSSNFSCSMHGWKDLKDASIFWKFNGYLLSLPEPVLLDPPSTVYKNTGEAFAIGFDQGLNGPSAYRHDGMSSMCYAVDGINRAKLEKENPWVMRPLHDDIIKHSIESVSGLRTTQHPCDEKRVKAYEALRNNLEKMLQNIQANKN